MDQIKKLILLNMLKNYCKYKLTDRVNKKIIVLLNLNVFNSSLFNDNKTKCV